MESLKSIWTCFNKNSSGLALVFSFVVFLITGTISTQLKFQTKTIVNLLANKDLLTSLQDAKQLLISAENDLNELKKALPPEIQDNYQFEKMPRKLDEVRQIVIEAHTSICVSSKTIQSLSSESTEELNCKP